MRPLLGARGGGPILFNYLGNFQAYATSCRVSIIQSMPHVLVVYRLSPFHRFLHFCFISLALALRHCIICATNLFGTVLVGVREQGIHGQQHALQDYGSRPRDDGADGRKPAPRTAAHASPGVLSRTCCVLSKRLVARSIAVYRGCIPVLSYALHSKFCCRMKPSRCKEVGMTVRLPLGKNSTRFVFNQSFCGRRANEHGRNGL